MKKAIHKFDRGPVEEVPCLACTTYSRAYLHHLFKAGRCSARCSPPSIT